MNKEKCFNCIVKAAIYKNKLWQECKLTWGEDVELSRILEKACSYAELNAEEVAAAARAEIEKAA